MCVSHAYGPTSIPNDAISTLFTIIDTSTRRTRLSYGYECRWPAATDSGPLTLTLSVPVSATGNQCHHVMPVPCLWALRLRLRFTCDEFNGSAYRNHRKVEVRDY